MEEGFVRHGGFETWYRIVGDGGAEGLPVLCLHGGPGSPHDYLESLAGLTASGRKVVFYDQVGCGRSSKPSDPSLWTIDLFVDEIRAVRDALGLDRLHLLGHSWGGMLAIEYLLREDEGVASVVLASALSSTQVFVQEAARLRAEAPPEIKKALDTHEAAGTIDDPRYDEAVMAFYRLHSCRVDPWPDSLVRAFENMRLEVYNTMWGPNEMNPNGTLADWDVRDRLGEIGVPTLVTCGRYDESTPEIARSIHEAIPGSRLEVFEDSSHTPFVEETDAYLETLAGFFASVEG